MGLRLGVVLGGQKGKKTKIQNTGPPENRASGQLPETGEIFCLNFEFFSAGAAMVQISQILSFGSWLLQARALGKTNDSFGLGEPPMLLIQSKVPFFR